MYNPSSITDRIKLAGLIEMKLVECGFTKVENGSQLFKGVRDPRRELVYSRQIKDGLSVVVYTTVVERNISQVRESGKDAIRIVGTYMNEETGTTRGVVKQKRVNRTGELSGIVDRMHQRMRDTWKLCNQVRRCTSCGAPKFEAKSGNIVCAEVCWTR